MWFSYVILKRNHSKIIWSWLDLDLSYFTFEEVFKIGVFSQFFRWWCGRLNFSLPLPFTRLYIKYVYSSHKRPTKLAFLTLNILHFLLLEHWILYKNNIAFLIACKLLSNVRIRVAVYYWTSVMRNTQKLFTYVEVKRISS